MNSWLSKVQFIWKSIGTLSLIAATVLTGTVSAKVLPKNNLQIQSHQVYLPLIMRTIPEIDSPPCRWPHTIGQNTYISYRYGSNLQTPGTLYRNAFNSSLVDWGSVPTYVRFYYSTAGSVTLDTYWAQDNRAGYAQPYCNGITTVAYSAFAHFF